MQLFVEVVFYSNQRECLPVSGYRPDAVFNKLNDAHYREVREGQRFQIMEGPRQIGAGIIISIDND